MPAWDTVEAVQQVYPTTDAVVDSDPVDVYHGDLRPAPGTRPWVLMNMIASVDGATAVDGVSEGLGGPADRRMLGTLRGLADVILVGAKTVRAEDYRLPRLPDDRVAVLRATSGRPPRPRLAVVSASLSLDIGRVGGPAAAGLHLDRRVRRPAVGPCQGGRARGLR